MRLTKYDISFLNSLRQLNECRIRIRLDDEIFEQFMSTFPELNVEPYEGVTKLDEEAMKSKDGKEKWRVFIQS